MRVPRQFVERDRTIANMYVKNHVIMREIGKRFGISRQRVEQIIRRECPDLKFRKIQKKRTINRNKHILSQPQKTNKEIARDLQLVPSYIATIRHGTKYNHRYSDTLEERFWRYVEKTKSCWLWTSCMGGEKGTQPRFQKNRKGYSAHRFAWELLKGKIPVGMFLIRKCGNYRCVNPEHMEVSRQYGKRMVKNPTQQEVG